MTDGVDKGLTQALTRRRVLRAGAVGTLGALAGCSEQTDAGTTDTPPDPPRPNQPGSTTHVSGDDLDTAAQQRSISVKTTPFSDPALGFPQPLSHATKYSYATIDVDVQSDAPDVAALDVDEEYVVEALAYRYTTDDAVGSGESKPFTPAAIGDSHRATVDVEFYRTVLDERLAYLLCFRRAFLPSFQTLDRVMPVAVLTATNPFRVTRDGIEPALTAQERASATIDYTELTTENHHPSRGSYTRLNVEGGYHVYFSPETPRSVMDVATEIPFYVPKLVYDRCKEAARPRHPEPPGERTAYVTESFTQGIGDHFAAIVDVSAQFHGARTDRARIQFASTFVQSLPYALDRVSTGYRDYSRYPAETLVDARGDCVDTSILLCAALLGGPVDCKVGFFSFDPSATAGPAGHLAVAVSLDDISLPGPSFHIGNRSYHYIEPTGFFEPGTVPSLITFEKAPFHPIAIPE